MELLTNKEPVLAPACVGKTGGGKFFKALLQSSFLLLLLLIALPLQAAHSSRIITVTQDSAICYADSDGCYNYILQAGEWRKATGKKLRAGRSFLHTTYDVTRDSSGGEAVLAQLLQQEGDSFRLETRSLLSRAAPYLWFLLGVAIWFGGFWLYRWTRRRRMK